MRHLRPGNRQPLERRQHPPQGTAKHPFDRLHQPENLLQLCGSGATGCHGWVHAHPKRAYRLGYLVHMGKAPATIPVYYRTGGWQQLNADSTRHPCPPPEDLPAHIDIKKGNE